MRWMLVWMLNAVALWLVARWVPGVRVTAGAWPLLVAVVVLGLVNTLLKPVLVLLTLPITLVTLGLFLLVLNGLLFYAVAKLDVGLQVDSLGSAILGALAYSVLSWALSSLLPARHG